MPRLSAIICTHNPREEYLRRVLEGLRSQSLPAEQWELLLVDNASKEPLAERFDLSWHVHGKHLRAAELGLTPARLRGIVEARGEYLVFVDDDNVLRSDYLEQAIAVGEQKPFLGVWGGNIIPEFEIDPPNWCKEHIWRLSVTRLTEDVWSNLREGFATVPGGAGMCIRKNVGLKFMERCQYDDSRKALGRKGAALSGYEDVDLAHCAIDLGQGTGKFTCLYLTHLIPASRITLDYFVRHAEADAASLMMFRTIRGLPVTSPDESWVEELRWQAHRLLSRKPPETIKIQEADRRGRKMGWERVRNYQAALNSTQ